MAIPREVFLYLLLYYWVTAQLASPYTNPIMYEHKKKEAEKNKPPAYVTAPTFHPKSKVLEGMGGEDPGSAVAP